MTYKSDRIGSALRGENPTVLRRLHSSFAVIGDVQFLPGYCVLLLDDPDVEQFSDLSKARRLNLEILGNSEHFVHAHLWPRYDWEPADMVTRPVWAYPRGRWHDPQHALGVEHKQMRDAIVAELDSVLGRGHA
ncbi:diadenosine tetraphosphate hydrolase [Streptomyces sp. NPDC053048]|uniref:diadenosine tetraphosphate hydrolase n=1 Tax=Streptomyces sp. NPDC053048 TaxID=3365694 RepID=UPI0037D486F4